MEKGSAIVVWNRRLQSELLRFCPKAGVKHLYSACFNTLRAFPSFHFLSREFGLSQLHFPLSHPSSSSASLKIILAFVQWHAF